MRELCTQLVWCELCGNAKKTNTSAYRATHALAPGGAVYLYYTYFGPAWRGVWPIYLYTYWSGLYLGAEGGAFGAVYPHMYPSIFIYMSVYW